MRVTRNLKVYKKKKKIEEMHANMQIHIKYLKGNKIFNSLFFEYTRIKV